MSVFEVVVAGSVLGLLASGCGHEPTGAPGGATTTSASMVPGAQAANAIGHARCKREDACNNIGSGQKYESMEACVSELSHDERAALRVEQCPNGVGDGPLSRCLDSIKNERCGNPLDSASRLATCRRSEVCR